MKHFGIVKPGSVLRFEFDTFNSTGASVTLTGLAVTDIEIYKDGSTTQRSSDNGYALVDTDGIDIDGITGIHEFTVDLADNSVAGFYAAGSKYRVVVSSVTVDGSTVSFTAGTFEIGYPSAILNTTIATLSSQTSFTLTAGPAEDDALNGMWCVIHDVASAVQFGRALILDYTGSTKTVTLAAGTTFTAAAADNFSVIDMAPLQPTTTGRTLDVSSGGEAGLDWANIGSPTTTVALSGTSVLLTSGTGTGQLSLSSGTVTVGTNNDKAGYSLSQSFPTNFASLAITGGGAVTAGTVSDKTGYSLSASQTFDVTGNITGNLSGSVGSVSGAVGSVTGNVGGSVASVTARVTANTDQWNGVSVTGMPMPTYTQPTGFLAATFPGTVASTTNITAASGVTLAAATHTGAVIPTVTTLTNDPSGVTTLLSRIPSGIFTGMTSLAQWLGLIAGKQTGDTTARTELRATGAGAGTFNETTDSIEAIRDRGDAAWVTATGFSTHSAADVVTALGTGTTLTAVPWNASWDAEVQSEVQDAIEVNHLDHLLAVDYDPANKPGVATALLNELIESDAGVSRYTANALEQAPTGGGTPQTGDAYAYLVSNLGSAGVAATEAGGTGDQLTAIPWNASWDAEVQSEVADALGVYDPPTNAEMEARTIVAADYAREATLTTMKGATFNGSTDSLEAIRDRGDAAWTTATGFSTLTESGVRNAVGLNAANLDNQLGDIPTNSEMVTAITNLLTTQMTEAYAADGTAPTLAQCLFLIQQSLHEFAISGNTRTVKRLDGTTTAATFTLDSATAPTSTTRAT